MRSLHIIIGLGFLGLCLSAPFDAEGNVVYELNRSLKVGDVVSAWGIYKDDTTDKFSVNILGEFGLFLLHVDFRPSTDTLVLNNKADDDWETAIRLDFSMGNFGADETFKVTIEVLEGEYKISLNDVEIGATFPQRNDISLATAVALHGGSNGFQWTSIELPVVVTGNSYALGKPLAVGDVIEACGIYKDDTTDKFSVNILGESGIFLLHVDFRPSEDIVVLNNKAEDDWDTEIRPEFSRDNFGADQTFKVTIEVMDREYKISFNDVEIGATFPQRDDISLATAVAVHGGSNGFQWTRLNLLKALQ